MKGFTRVSSILVVVLLGLLTGKPSKAQDTGSIAGVVLLADNGEPVRGSLVLLVELGQTATTDFEGRFAFVAVPPGEYQLLAQRQHLTMERQRISVHAGETVEVQISLALSPVHESVMVTVSPGGEMTTLEAFNSVISVDSVDLMKNVSSRWGEILAKEPGVTNSSFGAAASRPMIRGFDGDRVLIMQDGIGTGDMTYSCHDSAISLDPAALERFEVVKGPATLLYGSSAIGGVVNAVTPQESFVREKPVGFQGQITADAGTADNQAGAGGQFQYGEGNWAVWGAGSGRHTDDYNTPEGVVENSDTRLANGRVGVGYYGDRTYASFGYQREDNRYGVPFAGELEAPGEGLRVVDDITRNVARVDFGWGNLENAFMDNVRVALNYVSHQQDEFEVQDGLESLATAYDNQTWELRGEVEQHRTENLTGKVGAWGSFRDFVPSGEEALTPPATRKAFALFAYEELRVAPKVRLQFGGRLESNDYQPEARVEAEDEHGHGHDEGEGEDIDFEPPFPEARSFTGFSGSLGFHFDLAGNTAFVANVTRSYRAPSLEELYDFGPDAGSHTFSVGDPTLDREASWGLDLSLRNQSRWLQGSLDFYYYGIDNFIFAGYTDEFVDGFRLAPILQGDSRFVGFDAKGVFNLHRYLWLDLGVGYVNASLTQTDEPLPRIPPLHASIGFDVNYRAFSVSPELVLAGTQDRVFGDETSTDGYTVFNVNASYTLAQSHAAHVFSVRGYNLTNEDYRNHTSFIKDFAPEIGRGVKVSYSLRFF